MDRACNTKIEKRNACRLLVERPEGKRLLRGQQDVSGRVILRSVLKR
jgi:hypothetical protein